MNRLLDTIIIFMTSETHAYIMSGYNNNVCNITGYEYN